MSDTSNFKVFGHAELTFGVSVLIKSDQVLIYSVENLHSKVIIKILLTTEMKYFTST